MNADAKLVAAAKRAARKISHAEDIPHQAALDRVARQAGRGTWSAFVASPVAVDQASAEAAAEPDFSETSPDAHLLAAIDYGVVIGARALLARPETSGGTQRLVYCTARSEEYDRPIDPRGLSVAAMVTALATAPKNAEGQALLQDGHFAFELDDLGGAVQLRLSMDETLPPSASLAPDPEPEERKASRRHERLLMRARKVADAPFIETFDDPYDVLDSMVMLAWSSSRADLLFDVHQETVDVVLEIGETRRIVHVMTIDDYPRPLAMAKDRGRLDPMEWRVPQYGGWQVEIDSALRQVHVMTDPSSMPGRETLRIGFTPFPKRPYARRPGYDTPEAGRLPLGDHGLFVRETLRASPQSLIVVSGGKGSGRTSRYVVPSILNGRGADVIVSDMAGTLPARLGDEWTRHEARLHLDPRAEPTRRAPGFNPFHPDMMPSGHVNAAEWVAATLVPGDSHVHEAARSLFVGIVDIVVRLPDLRSRPDTEDDVATLPMMVDWLEANADRVGTVRARIEGTDAIVGQARLDRFLALPETDRRTAVATLHAALSFVRDEAMARILAPADEGRGSALATALILRRTPALIVVGGHADKGQGRLCALVMQAAIHLRDDFALRETHLYVDDAGEVGPMPWLRRAIASKYGTPSGISAAIVLDDPHQIDVLAPQVAAGRAEGIAHWLVEEVSDPAHRERIADAMGVRPFRVTAHKADRRRLVVDGDGVRMLRR